MDRGLQAVGYPEGVSLPTKLLSMIKLDKNQRELFRAGMVDENGNLTPAGSVLLLNLVLNDYTDKLAELAKEHNKEVKESRK